MQGDACMTPKDKSWHIIDNIGSPIVVKNSQYMVVFANDAACQILGVPRDNFVGKTDHDLIPKENADEIRIRDSLVLETGKKAHIEHLLTDTSGNFLSTLATKSLHVNDDGERYIITAFQDITPIKHSEKALQGLNRKLRAISECNRLLLRSTDELSLMNKICEIVCREGGYYLAWVGYVEYDDAKTVRPVRWAGVEDPYLTQMHITWADNEQGRSPIGTAVRTGKTMSIQNIPDEPRNFHWKETAIAKKYRSVIALPLKAENGNVLGVFSIISTETEAFPPKEVRLLEKLAADLEFGITVLRNRAEQHRMKQALAESELKYRSVVENCHVGIAIQQDNIYRYVNKHFSELFGYTHDEMVDKLGFLDLLHPDAYGDSVEDTLAMIPFGKIHEASIIKKDGSTIILSVMLSSITYQGRPAIAGTVSDVTKQKMSEQELLTNRLQLSEAMDLAHIVYWEVDITTQTFIFNDALYAFLGTTAEREGGYRMTSVEYGKQFIHPDDQPAYFRALEFYSKIWTAKDIPELEHRIVRRDGQVLQVLTRVRAINDASGSIARVYGTNQDITDRKQMELALQESEERFRKVFEESPLAMVMVGADFHFIGANTAFCGMLGYTEQELSSRTFRELMHTDPTSEKDMFMNGQFHGKILDRTEIRFIRKDNTLVWCTVTLSTIHDNENRFLYHLATMEDITRQKEAEKEKTRLESQLRQSQKMEAIGTLAGGVAHDFNNMLGVILGYAELALNDIGPDHPLHTSLQEIRNAANRSADLTRQLLAFARKQTIAPKMLDLNKTIEGALKMLRRLIGENIDLSWLPGADAGPVEMDPSQIDQILANLCVNARDAITDVGNVTIETGAVTLDEEYSNTHPGFLPGDFVMLSVTDDGHGMDKSTVEKIFEPFFSTKERGKGTGLGLSTVYGIVKQNYGFINAYSEPGHGTTIRIYLPRHVEKDTRKQKKTRPATTVYGHETILLVEDESAILNLTERILVGFGYRVLTASHPAEAISLAQKHAEAIDLLLTDLVMPDMNGKELANAILALCPKIKLLFMSGYTRNAIAHHGILKKGIHLLQKPFSVKVLGTKVREVLDKAQS